MLGGAKIGSQHLSANPAASDARARINDKFQRYENKFASDPRISDGRRETLNRVRVFLLNLIDLGYAPLMVHNWCGALLNNQIDDAMPMDLVDAYWGQPVETQEFVDIMFLTRSALTEPLTAITARLLTRTGLFPGQRPMSRTSESGNLTSGSCR